MRNVVQTVGRLSFEMLGVKWLPLSHSGLDTNDSQVATD